MAGGISLFCWSYVGGGFGGLGWCSIRIWGGGYCMVLDDYFLLGHDVAAVLVEAAGDFYGADYGVAAGSAFAGMFDDAIQGVADMGAAEVPEAAGVGMAVEGGEAG